MRSSKSYDPVVRKRIEESYKSERKWKLVTIGLAIYSAVVTTSAVL